MELYVPVLFCPEIERDGSQFVDNRDGQAVLAQIDGLQVGPASIAAFHADVGELGGGINRQLEMVFLFAAGTDDAMELPLAETESAEQVAAGSVPHLPQHAQPWFPAAERAE